MKNETDQLRRIRQERDGLLNEARSLLEADDYDENRYDELTEQIDELNDRYQNVADLTRQVTAGTAHIERGIDPGPNVHTTSDPWSDKRPFTGQEDRSQLRDNAMRALERIDGMPGDVQTRNERLARKPEAARMFVALSDPDYLTAFGKVYSDPDHGRDRFNEAERAAFSRAMSLSNVTGVMVPSQLDPTIMLSNDGTSNPFRRTVRTVTGTDNVWTGLSSAGVTASWDAEGEEVSDDSPSFSNPSATAFKGSAFIPISIEAFEDLRDGESGELLQVFADAKDRLEATAFTTGNGTSEPKGLITALDSNTNVEVSTTTSNVFGLTDVYKLYESLPARWRNDPSAAWYANVAIIDDIRQFGTDSLSTQTVDLTAEGVPMILGKPVYEVDDMDGTVGTAGTDSILAFGAARHYVVYDRLGSQIELVPHLFGSTNGRPTGQRGWYFHFRTGATATVETAWRLLQAATN